MMGLQAMTMYTGKERKKGNVVISEQSTKNKQIRILQLF